jgi:NifU-like protein
MASDVPRGSGPGWGVDCAGFCASPHRLQTPLPCARLWHGKMASRAADNIICRCYVVAEDVIRQAIADHQLKQVEEVTAVTRAGGGCSSCWDDIQAILNSVWGKPLPRDVPDSLGLSNAQRRALIVKALEKDVTPLFDRNGLQIQLVDVGGDRVLVRFFGRGVGSQAASFLALKRYLVHRLTEACGHKMNLVELNVLEALAP